MTPKVETPDIIVAIQQLYLNPHFQLFMDWLTDKRADYIHSVYDLDTVLDSKLQKHYVGRLAAIDDLLDDIEVLNDTPVRD